MGDQHGFGIVDAGEKTGNDRLINDVLVSAETCHRTAASLT